MNVSIDEAQKTKAKTEKLIEAFIQFGAIISVFIAALSLYNLAETRIASTNVKTQAATIEAFKMESTATQTAALATSSAASVAQKEQLDAQSERLILLESPVFSASTEKLTHEQLLTYVNTSDGVSRLVSSNFTQEVIREADESSEYVVIVFTNLGRTAATDFKVTNITYSPPQPDDFPAGKSIRPIRSITSGSRIALIIYAGTEIVEVDPLEKTGVTEVLVSYIYKDRFETAYTPSDIVALDLDFEDENGNEIAVADIVTSADIGSGPAGFITNATIDFDALNSSEALDSSNLAIPSLVRPSIDLPLVLPVDVSQIELAQP